MIKYILTKEQFQFNRYTRIPDSYGHLSSYPRQIQSYDDLRNLIDYTCGNIGRDQTEVAVYDSEEAGTAALNERRCTAWISGSTVYAEIWELEERDYYDEDDPDEWDSTGDSDSAPWDETHDIFD